MAKKGDRTPTVQFQAVDRVVRQREWVFQLGEGGNAEQLMDVSVTSSKPEDAKSDGNINVVLTLLYREDNATLDKEGVRKLHKMLGSVLTECDRLASRCAALPLDDDLSTFANDLSLAAGPSYRVETHQSSRGLYLMAEYPGSPPCGASQAAVVSFHVFTKGRTALEFADVTHKEAVELLTTFKRLRGLQ